MFFSKFIYDLLGHTEPSNDELDEDIDRLLFLKGVESPNYLYESTEQSRDLTSLDANVIESWIKRRFEPPLVLLLLEHENNQYMARTELGKMYTQKTWVERYYRYDFVRRRANQRIKEICFDNPNNLKLTLVVERLQKTLDVLSKHLEDNDTNLTLLGTDTYTSADITLYNYLKRIVVGRYKDFGLRTHVRLSEPLRQFMRRYAKKNTCIIDISTMDPLADPYDQSSLLADLTRPAMVALIAIGFFIWRRENMSKWVIEDY